MTNPIPTGDDVSDKPKADFTVTFYNDRQVGFRDLGLGQRMMLQRVMRQKFVLISQLSAAMDDESDPEREVKLAEATRLTGALLHEMWDVVDSTILEEDDRDFLVKGMLTGQVDYADMQRILRRGAESEPDDDEDPQSLTGGKDVKKSEKKPRRAQ